MTTMHLKSLMAATALTATLLTAVPGAVQAHGGATGVVKQRMDAMGTAGDAMKALKGYVTGETPFDAAQVENLAKAIGATAGEKLTALFPKGSLDMPSEAKPEIWDQWERFESLAKDLELKSAALAEGMTKPDAAQTFRAGFGQVAQTCKACHTDFREKKAK